MAKRKRSPFIVLTAKDWTEIFYAVELKRKHVAWISTPGTAKCNALPQHSVQMESECTKP